jgi:hypothetical protein
VGKVLISYSHDRPEHSERVLALSNSLRAIGVDAELDRYHGRPPHGWAIGANSSSGWKRRASCSSYARRFTERGWRTG